jgi:hypothetical protein
MPSRRVVGLAAQKVQSIGRAGNDRRRREDLGSGGSQLERQGQPVQLSAHLDHAGGVARVEPELGADSARPFEEEGNRGHAFQLARARVAVGREQEGSHRILVLPAQPQRLAAGGQHLEPWRRLQKTRQLGRGRQHMFTRVQHDEQARLGRLASHTLAQEAHVDFGNTHCLADRVEHQPGLPHRGKIYEEDGLKGIADALGGGQGEARLTDSARARQREQAHHRVEDEPTGVLELDLPIDEPGW